MPKKAIVTLLLSGFAASALADPDGGAYVGTGIGASRFHVDAITSPRASIDRSAAAQKIYLGYGFSEYWGAELGLVNLGRFTARYAAGEFRARSEAMYLAATARLPVTARFTLTGKLMLSHGRTKAEQASRGISAFDDLRRSGRSVTGGSVGAEYALTSRSVAALEFDNLGAVSRKTDATMLSLNLKYRF